MPNLKVPCDVRGVVLVRSDGGVGPDEVFVEGGAVEQTLFSGDAECVRRVLVWFLPLRQVGSVSAPLLIWDLELSYVPNQPDP